MKTGVAKEISQSFNVFHTEAYKRVRLFFSATFIRHAFLGKILTREALRTKLIIHT